jgi:phosphopentomutase
LQSSVGAGSSTIVAGGRGRRAIVLVADACGVGALPDAAQYGDEGTNTLAHLAQAVGGLLLPTLQALGLGSIIEIEGVARALEPVVHGRAHPLGPGKDSITGHWELMGIVLERALPTYPRGFPAEVIALLERVTGHAFICNAPRDGVAAIEEFGAEHLRTGALILYTSQDSVLQLAAHVERIAPAALYEACAAARAALRGEHAVGRAIARPFEGRDGAFERTAGRRDLTLRPPARSYLEELGAAGVAVHGVGKVSDLFGGVGITRSHPGADNATALASVDSALCELDRGLVLANLIETDQTFGHRKDVEGFHRALSELDAYLAHALSRLRPDDLLVVTADHGVDPLQEGSDHTREYAPLLAVTGAMWGARAVRDGGGEAAAQRAVTELGAAERERRHDGPLADVGATVLRWLTGSDAAALPGEPFAEALA